MRQHAVTPLGVDEDDDEILHAPELRLEHETEVPRCGECQLPAGTPYVDACAIGRHQNDDPERGIKKGDPRRPDLYDGWLVYFECRGVAVCPTERCERAHIVRHRVARERQRERSAA